MTDQKLQNPIFPWMGSKFRMRKNILGEIERRKHSIFVEVFGGTGTIMFNKKPVKKNVLNDFNQRVYNFFMCLSDKKSFESFLHYYNTLPVSRKIYELMLKEWKYDNDSVKRAFSFFYIQNFSFSGKEGGSFLPDVTDTNDSFLLRYNNRKSRIGAFADFIKNYVLIENRDFRELIRYYDRSYALFYCDPPYVIKKRQGKQSLYAHELTNKDHEELVDLLLNIKGQCVLSGYESDIYRPLLDAGWKIKKIEATASIARLKNKGNQKRIECLYLSPVRAD